MVEMNGERNFFYIGRVPAKSNKKIIKIEKPTEVHVSEGLRRASMKNRASVLISPSYKQFVKSRGKIEADREF